MGQAQTTHKSRQRGSKCTVRAPLAAARSPVRQQGHRKHHTSGVKKPASRSEGMRISRRRSGSMSRGVEHAWEAKATTRVHAPPARARPTPATTTTAARAHTWSRPRAHAARRTLDAQAGPRSTRAEGSHLTHRVGGGGAGVAAATLPAPQRCQLLCHGVLGEHLPPQTHATQPAHEPTSNVQQPQPGIPPHRQRVSTKHTCSSASHL